MDFAVTPLHLILLTGLALATWLARRARRQEIAGLPEPGPTKPPRTIRTVNYRECRRRATEWARGSKTKRTKADIEREYRRLVAHAHKECEDFNG